MRAWQERPPEVAALLNPAFCSLLLRESVRGYQAEAGAPMPFPLIVFVLPIALHVPTRNVLPTIRAKMHVWLQEHEEAKVLFAPRARNLLPYAREALMFAVSRGVLQFDANGAIHAGRKRLKTSSWIGNVESTESLSTADFIGRWMARTGDIQSIFIIWGVRP